MTTKSKQSKRQWLQRTAIGTLTIAILGLGYTVKGETFEEQIWSAVKTGLMDLGLIAEMDLHPLERREQNENDLVLDTAKFMFMSQMKSLFDKTHRDAHAKAHGCVAGDFEVLAGSPAWAQKGLFATPAHYEALVRYSNGSGKTANDQKPDGRGMAIKVIGGAPKGNLLGIGNNQDFMMINFPKFFSRSIRDYAHFNKCALNGDLGPYFAHRAIREAFTPVLGEAVAEGLAGADVDVVLVNAVTIFTLTPKLDKTQEEQEKLNQAFGILSQILRTNGYAGQDLIAKTKETLSAIGEKLSAMKPQADPNNVLPNLAKAPREFQIVMGIQSAPIPSALNTSYFSMASFAFPTDGQVANDTAVKYSVHPVPCSEAGKPSESTGPHSSVKTIPPLDPQAVDVLTETLTSSMAAQDYCFNFVVEALDSDLELEKKRSQVEDSTLDFSKSQKAIVATLKMRAQDNSSPAQKEYCENLSFNPWHARPEYRPLGAMNRARRVAVKASSLRRHDLLLNPSAKEIEPTTFADFANFNSK